MTSLLIFLLATRHATGPLDRYVQWRKAHPDFTVRWTAQAGKAPKATGSMTIQGRKRLLFRAKWFKSDYSLSLSEAGYVEIERYSRVYDERPYPGGVMLDKSRISGTPEYTLPGFLLRNDLRMIVPKNVPFVPDAANPDLLRAKIESPMGVTKIATEIDAAGRIVSYAVEGSHGPKLSWVLSNYKTESHLTAKNFITPLPLGYSPHALPTDSFPLQIGEKAPLNGWLSIRSGKSVNFAALAQGKELLIAVLGEDSGPCLAAAPSLKTLSAKLPVFRVSDSPSGRNSLADYVDRSGKLLGTLSVPSTPFFLLVGKDGKVKKLWMGFDRDHPDQFIKGVTAALG